MGRMLTEPVLPLLPEGATEIAPDVGIVTGADGGGLVTVHGLATFAWDGGDEAGRRLAAVQLVRLRAASQSHVAAAFGADPATVWRWDSALVGGGVSALVPSRRGPKGASRLTAQLVARIAGLDAGGKTLRQITAATGVSTFSVRSALGRVAAREQAPAGGGALGGGQRAQADALSEQDEDGEQQDERLPVLPDRCPAKPSGRWPRSPCSARAPSRCSRPGRGSRWPGCCWPCPRWRPPG